MLYQCSNYRDIKNEIGIQWNDQNLKINWPRPKFNILSNKDIKNISFNEYKKRL